MRYHWIPWIKQSSMHPLTSTIVSQSSPNLAQMMFRQSHRHQRTHTQRVHASYPGVQDHTSYTADLLTCHLLPISGLLLCSLMSKTNEKKKLSNCRYEIKTEVVVTYFLHGKYMRLLNYLHFLLSVILPHVDAVGMIQERFI